MTKKSANHESAMLGREAEKAVRNYFAHNGFREITHNYSVFRIGELDLIFLKKDTLYFIEVRLRKQGGDFASPEDSIGPMKKKKIRATAARFLSGYGYDEYDVCFLAACIRYDTEKRNFRLRIIPF